MADYGLGSWPARRARIDAQAVALRQGSRSLTYGQLAERVQSCAGALAASGVRPGERVAYLGANDLAAFEVFFAAGRLGAVFVPLNIRLAPPEIGYLLGDARPRVLVHSAELAPVVEAAGVDLDVVWQVGGAGPTAYDAAVGAAEPWPDDVGNIELDADAVILYTSGTTGRPKGAVLTHGNLTFNTMNQLAHVDVLARDVGLCISPLFHATGLGQVSLPILFKGGTVIVVAKFDAGEVLATIERERSTAFSAVPTMLQLMYDHPNFAETDLSTLRYVIYGGSAIAQRVAVGWQRRGVEVVQGYGMTEASPGVYMAVPGHGAARPLSIGVPHFFTDVRVDGDASGPRELLIRGLNVFDRYDNRPEDTARAFTDGWYRTGDVVRSDPDGWSYVVDRVTDMIISGGENVYPSEVEAAITELPGVLDCAVVGVPDERWGEVGSAFLAAEAPWTAESLRAALDGRIAAFKIPKYVRMVDELPRTATGKVQRERLRPDAAEGDS